MPVDHPQLPSVERRELPLGELELRDDGGKLMFIGHAAVFDRLSEDLGGFRERIQRGAFRKVLDKNPDVRFLFNHNPDHVMARTTNGTLELREDPKGLRVYAELAPTTMAQDLRTLVKRRDIDGMSFGFRVETDAWTEQDDELVRTVVAFRDLFDVGPVVFPAYAQTDATMRSLACGVELVTAAGDVRDEALRELAWRIHRRELEATTEERAAIDAAYARIESVSPWTAEQALRAAYREPELRAAVQGMRVTLELEEDDRDDSGEVLRKLAARRRRLALLDTDPTLGVKHGT